MEAIFYEDDLPEEQGPHLADNAAFFTESLPGRDSHWDHRAVRRKSVRSGWTRHWCRGCRGYKSEPRRCAGRFEGATTALTIPQIADELGVHPNTVRFHLDTLVTEAGSNVSSPTAGARPSAADVSRCAWDGPGGTRRYRVLAEILTLALPGTATPAPRHSRPARRGHGG